MKFRTSGPHFDFIPRGRDPGFGRSPIKFITASGLWVWRPSVKVLGNVNIYILLIWMPYKVRGLCDFQN
jgi:hypothetical protein